jgi:hypothetical protein
LSAAAAEVLTALFGDDYHFTVGAESVPYTRSFASFDAAAAEAGQSRIYGGIHYQFDNQAAQASGHALGRFVVGDFLLPTGEQDEADSRHDLTGGPRRDGPPQPFGDGVNSRHDDNTGSRAALQEEGRALLAEASNAAPANRGVLGGQPSAPATGQPRLLQPPQLTEVLAATSVDRDQPIQPAGARDRLPARELDLRVLDQALAGLDDSGSAETIQGGEAFAWAR